MRWQCLPVKTAVMHGLPTHKIQVPECNNRNWHFWVRGDAHGLDNDTISSRNLWHHRDFYTKGVFAPPSWSALRIVLTLLTLLEVRLQSSITAKKVPNKSYHVSFWFFLGVISAVWKISTFPILVFFLTQPLFNHLKQNHSKHCANKCTHMLLPRRRFRGFSKPSKLAPHDKVSAKLSSQSACWNSEVQNLEETVGFITLKHMRMATHPQFSSTNVLQSPRTLMTLMTFFSNSCFEVWVFHLQQLHRISPRWALPPRLSTCHGRSAVRLNARHASECAKSLSGCVTCPKLQQLMRYDRS